MHQIKVNNFDLIRLLAAFQVALHHGIKHFGLSDQLNGFVDLLALFPGVPIFFFVSGFLISKSFESNHNLKEFSINRALRIFPALVVCTLVSLMTVHLSGYMAQVDASWFEQAKWVFGQITFFQFYNPDFLRGYGVGVINGSLWSIAVELQFYFLIPVIYWLFGLMNIKGDKRLFILVIFFIAFHQIKFSYFEYMEENVWLKLYGVSFLPWFYMFMVGILAQRNYRYLYDMLSGKALYIFILYLSLAYVLVEYAGFRTGNGMGPLLYLLLAALVFSVAYTVPTLSKTVVKGNDVSYGVYIYHMPIINTLIYFKFHSSLALLSTTLGLTFVCALSSWFLVEKNAMRFKAHPMKSVS